MVETTALSPHLGVQVTGVEDLLDDAVASRCPEALKWRGVLLFRGLHLDDEAQIAFSRRLGEVVAPRGQTEFARHLRRLREPARRRKRYDGLRVHHSFEASQRLVDPTRARRSWRRRGGRRSLVIGSTAEYIAGMDTAESRALLDELLHRTTVYGDEGLHYELHHPHSMISSWGGMSPPKDVTMVKPVERVLRSGLFGPWDRPSIEGLDPLPPAVNPSRHKAWGVDCSGAPPSASASSRSMTCPSPSVSCCCS